MKIKENLRKKAISPRFILLTYKVTPFLKFRIWELATVFSLTPKYQYCCLDWSQTGGTCTCSSNKKDWVLHGHINFYNCNGGVMVSMLTLSAVLHGFNPRSIKTKDYKINIYWLQSKQQWRYKSLNIYNVII
jgi:hypothetical protein